VIVDPRFRPVGTLVASSGKLLLYRPSGVLRLASAIEGVLADGTTTGLAAYTCWAQCSTRVQVDAEDAAAVVRVGTFAPLPGGGGKIASVMSKQPQPPFRIEVRAKPGTHVRFVGA
jgi:hypothetical protein